MFQCKFWAGRFRSCKTLKVCLLWRDWRLWLNVHNYICRGKNTLFLSGEAKYSLNVTFPLQSCLLYSTILTPVSGSFFFAREIPSTSGKFIIVENQWWTHKGWLSPCLKMTFCWGNSDLKKICFHLVFPCMAKCQVSTWPQFPRPYVYLCESRFNLIKTID